MSRLSGASILVADDERYITATLSLKLRQAGAVVLVANNGAEAFELACAHIPDLIITDFQMPEMSGLELGQRLKAKLQTAQIPVMMLTAKGLRIPHEELQRTNIKSLIAKPFSLREVVGEVEQWLSNRACRDR